MQPFKSEMMRELAERGFMHQCSDPAALDALAQKERRTEAEADEAREDRGDDQRRSDENHDRHRFEHASGDQQSATSTNEQG